MTFYETVKSLCIKRGISLSTMADEIKISNGTISAWKQGSNPNSSTVRKIADFFNVTTDYLMTGGADAIETFDDDTEIFTAIETLKDKDIRRLVLKLRRASHSEVMKVIEMLEIFQIGGSVDV